MIIEDKNCDLIRKWFEVILCAKTIFAYVSEFGSIHKFHNYRLLTNPYPTLKYIITCWSCWGIFPELLFSRRFMPSGFQTITSEFSKSLAENLHFCVYSLVVRYWLNYIGTGRVPLTGTQSHARAFCRPQRLCAIVVFDTQRARLSDDVFFVRHARTSVIYTLQYIKCAFVLCEEGVLSNMCLPVLIRVSQPQFHSIDKYS